MTPRRNFFLRALTACVVGGALSLVRVSAQPAEGAEATDVFIARGRAVYVAEGCIHCHSQFIRPGSVDVERWGPVRNLAEVLQASPPLFGNRRQGPDLANVGNRRTPEWNRLHLIAPRSVSPGSRMPTYAHLFRAGDDRGEALVAYLASLGGETFAERVDFIAAWQPSPASRAALAHGDATHGRQLFAQLCVNCHGPSGHGDGPLASKLSLAPPNWPAGGWRRLAPGADDSATRLELARLIKFGAPGTPMAGHETLTDRELADLVAHVRTLSAPAPSNVAIAAAR